MSKRPSPPNGSARVDAILRYRNASEGVLCASRCRELSRSGLTATVERPVFPGELLRIELEPPMGGPSVYGLARVSWTGSDPDGPPGASIMRLRFLSFSEASRSALTAWLKELSSIEARRSEAPAGAQDDDSAVRALSRAIADSLLPPPPVLPGAAPSTEGSGLTPVPVSLPHRASVPPPPGMYTRSSRTLSHAVDRIAPTVHAAMESARRSSRPPPPDAGTTLFGQAPMEPEPIGPAAMSRVQGETSASRRTAEIRERLNRLQARRDNTPLVVPLQGARGASQLGASQAISASRLEPSTLSPAVARVSLAPPLPLGALLNAPPETTRRSSPPPAGAVESDAPSSSWPALRVPPAVAAVGLPSEVTPEPHVERRTTIPPPAMLADVSPLHAAPPFDLPAYERDERAELPIDGPSLSDAPWSVPAPPPRASGVRPWVALCLGSVALGAGLAYWTYGPHAPWRSPSVEGAAASSGAAQSRAFDLDMDELLASQITLPKMPSLEDFTELQLPGTARRRPADARAASTALAGKAPTTPATQPADAVASPPTAAPAPSVTPAAPAPLPAPKPLPEAPAAPAAASAPPPPPELPEALSNPAPAQEASQASPAVPATRLESARACVARGDIECVTRLLKDATGEDELELWIETLRAQGRASEARSAMQRFVTTFPNARRATAYRRILTNAP